MLPVAGLLARLKWYFLLGFCSKGVFMLYDSSWFGGICWELEIARDQGYSNLILQTDCKVSVNLLEGSCPHTHSCFVLVSRIKALASSINTVQFSCV